MSISRISEDKFNLFPAFNDIINPKNFIPVIGSVLTWGYFQPTTLLGHTVTLLGGYGLSKLGLSFVESSIASLRCFQLMKQLESNRKSSIIPIRYDEDIFLNAFEKFKKEKNYSELIDFMGNETKLKNFLIDFVKRGLCRGEVEEISQLLKKKETLSSEEIIRSSDIESILFFQMVAASRVILNKDEFSNCFDLEEDIFKENFLKVITNSTNGLGMIGILFNNKATIEKIIFPTGHVIFFQCKSKKFRFYDSNTAAPEQIKGFYEFDSQEQLIENLKNFIKVFYEESIKISFAAIK
jgi:hypothetical protein